MHFVQLVYQVALIWLNNLMSRFNYFGKGDEYSEFHRYIMDDRLKMIDLDCVEYQPCCNEIIFIGETAKDKGITEEENPHHGFPPADVLERILIRGPICHQSLNAGNPYFQWRTHISLLKIRKA